MDQPGKVHKWTSEMDSTLCNLVQENMPYILDDRIRHKDKNWKTVLKQFNKTFNLNFKQYRTLKTRYKSLETTFKFNDIDGLNGGVVLNNELQSILVKIIQHKAAHNAQKRSSKLNLDKLETKKNKNNLHQDIIDNGTENNNDHDNDQDNENDHDIDNDDSDNLKNFEDSSIFKALQNINNNQTIDDPNSIVNNNDTISYNHNNEYSNNANINTNNGNIQPINNNDDNRADNSGINICENIIDTNTTSDVIMDDNNTIVNNQNNDVIKRKNEIIEINNNNNNNNHRNQENDNNKENIKLNTKDIQSNPEATPTNNNSISSLKEINQLQSFNDANFENDESSSETDLRFDEFQNASNKRRKAEKKTDLEILKEILSKPIQIKFRHSDDDCSSNANKQYNGIVNNNQNKTTDTNNSNNLKIISLINEKFDTIAKKLVDLEYKYNKRFDKISSNLDIIMKKLGD
ncbi:uncharacterized protein ASCRUDRAFT_80645 [Ascoidea rubescens DSM 1968]|uniref:Myb/SANT-like domain-containing protein n=1 Tax=Ascoidea rubescens DSM 1968 TaxID=1344418 RepID=A0A1D2VIY5_9ASCO|nr:hypothetical protein ASCRUDRAFT_80645 [Ascoidea rubescens DSM 1968]ODV61594.1 hypothetical protein ASCRUDRAFT_80645 [Ascoidea rubescens DSM 1968]